MFVYKGTNQIYPMPEGFSERLGSGMRDLFTELIIANEAIKHLEMGWPDIFHDSWVFQALPRSVALRANESFCECLLASHLSLFYKAFCPDPASPACLAEDMLLTWSIQWMFQEEATDKKLVAQVDDFMCHVMGECKHAFLYVTQADRIDDVPQKGLMPSAEEYWFIPHNKPLSITHPFTWPIDKRFCYANWLHLMAE